MAGDHGELLATAPDEPVAPALTAGARPFTHLPGKGRAGGSPRPGGGLRSGPEQGFDQRGIRPATARSQGSPEPGRGGEVATVADPGRTVPGPGRERAGCTAPQLKRFIKSRVYVPMHELRRRFQIDGTDDEVTTIKVGRDQFYVGLPDREGRLLGELLRTGDVGYELSLDPPTPIVVGLYPMRPIPRS